MARRSSPDRKKGGGKLTEAQVRKIRTLRSDGLTLKDIAERFGVTYQNVSLICNRSTWFDVREDV